MRGLFFFHSSRARKIPVRPFALHQRPALQTGLG